MARVTKGNSRRRHLAVSQQKQTTEGAKDFTQTTTKGSTDRPEKGESCQLPLFPRWTCYVVWAVTMSVRVHIATKHNWILHPDEIFQSIEVAYSEVYGYGFRSYEFGPVPRVNDTTGAGFAVGVERAAGMYAMRSFMYPRFLAITMMAAEAAGLQVGPFQAARLGHVLVSSLLPPAARRLTWKLYRSDDVANMAAILVALSDHLTILGTHTLINSFLSPFLFLSLAGIISLDKNTLERHLGSSGKVHSDSNKPEGSNTKFQLSWGAVLGLVCYIRVDAIIFLGAILISTTFPIQNNLRTLLGQFWWSGIGMLLGFTLGALDDYLCYGYWFISPIQWAKFNLFNDYTTLIFGEEDAMFYLRHLLLDSPFLSLVTASSVVILVFTALPNLAQVWSGLCLRIRKSLLHAELKPGPEHRNNAGIQPATPVLYSGYMSLRLTVALALLFSFYVAKGHKEVRFLHNWIVLFLVCCSGCLVNSLKSALSQNRTARGYVLYSIVGVLVATTWVTFPSPEDASVNSWAFDRHGDSGQVNNALSFIGRQRDAAGVFLDYPVYMTGGYSVLRRDVPVVGKVQREYREWSLSERTTLPATFTFTAGRTEVSVASFSKVAFLASEKNWLLLIRRLIDRPVYNYAIVPEGKTFLRTGFSMVKRFGTVVVLRRNDSAEENAALQTLRRKIPMGPNGSVLEGEARTLLTLGRVDMAVERLRAAIDLEPTRTSAQLLLQSVVKAAKNKQPTKLKDQKPHTATVDEQL
ncbi:uncharacterized protein LOC144913443 [Branchiostoma floridae x Branchiostoma belcheri]